MKFEKQEDGTFTSETPAGNAVAVFPSPHDNKKFEQPDDDLWAFTVDTGKGEVESGWHHGLQECQNAVKLWCDSGGPVLPKEDCLRPLIPPFTVLGGKLFLPAFVNAGAFYVESRSAVDQEGMPE